MATEKRLINVNKVIDEMQKCIDESPYERDSIASYTFGAIIECLKQEPTVDAVEVVRCKDCKYWWKEVELCTHPKCCDGMVAVVEAPKTHFCSYGERKNNDCT